MPGRNPTFAQLKTFIPTISSLVSGVFDAAPLLAPIDTDDPISASLTLEQQQNLADLLAQLSPGEAFGINMRNPVINVMTADTSVEMTLASDQPQPDTHPIVNLMIALVRAETDMAPTLANMMAADPQLLSAPTQPNDIAPDITPNVPDLSLNRRAI